jgi:signal transduction histidine kinase
VVQESLANAIRHSGTQEVLITLARDGEEVRVEIQDFGCGLPVLSPLDGRRLTGVGMAAMEERMAMVGGRLLVESDPQGVTVLASVTIAEAQANGNATAEIFHEENKNSHR